MTTNNTPNTPNTLTDSELAERMGFSANDEDGARMRDALVDMGLGDVPTRDIDEDAWLSALRLAMLREPGPTTADEALACAREIADSVLNFERAGDWPSDFTAGPFVSDDGVTWYGGRDDRGPGVTVPWMTAARQAQNLVDGGSAEPNGWATVWADGTAELA